MLSDLSDLSKNSASTYETQAKKSFQVEKFSEPPPQEVRGPVGRLCVRETVWMLHGHDQL